MYQCFKTLIKYKEYSCFDHSDFPTHSVFTFYVCCGSLGTSIFGSSGSVANNTLAAVLKSTENIIPKVSHSPAGIPW